MHTHIVVTSDVHKVCFPCQQKFHCTRFFAHIHSTHIQDRTYTKTGNGATDKDCNFLSNHLRFLSICFPNACRTKARTRHTVLQAAGKQTDNYAEWNSKKNIAIYLMNHDTNVNKTEFNSHFSVLIFSVFDTFLLYD